MIKYIKINKGVKPHGGKKGRYEKDIIYPNGRHTVSVAILTNAKTDTWGGVPMEYEIDEVEFLFEKIERIYDDRRKNI